jgi:yecA family protein
MIEFNQADKLALANWLASDAMNKAAMPLAQLEGFLFALVAAPSPIIEDVWVSQALGEKSAELADDKLFALMAFHNDVSEQVFEYRYNLPSRIEIVSPNSANLASNSELHLWAHGFALGIAHYIEPIVSSTQLNPELSEALGMALGYLCFFADLSNDANLCGDVLELITSFAEGYAELIEACVLDAGLVVDEDDGDFA